MSMKICPKCKENKPKTEFYKRNDGRPYSSCKKCWANYTHDRTIQKKKDAISYKGGICFDCKKSYDYYLYDFHHIDPTTKEFIWDKLRCSSKAKIKKELDKCILLCCMCHRIREYKKL